MPGLRGPPQDEDVYSFAVQSQRDGLRAVSEAGPRLVPALF